MQWKANFLQSLKNGRNWFELSYMSHVIQPSRTIRLSQVHRSLVNLQGLKLLFVLSLMHVIPLNV